MMANFKERNARYFPIKSMYDIIQLFKHQLEGKPEPDLALLSLVVGAVENIMTIRSMANEKEYNSSSDDGEPITFPIIEFELVGTLYNKFQKMIKSSVDPKIYKGKFATHEIIKRISDVIWNSLARSYHKDKAHMQSLYSYVTTNKLDSFGVALTVVAACQLLGYKDVHLVLSEDHTWVAFGKDGSETAEITWHGKGTEDKRGKSVTSSVAKHSWLYLAGFPVVCSRYTEVAALVSAINPSLNISCDAHEISILQKELLWLLYDKGLLDHYPMAIGNLGELEELFPDSRKPSCLSLYQQAIQSAKILYSNHHVYPYIYQGGYYYRKEIFKNAFLSWANASNVIRLYNYSRDDEEIYKEFLEVANELIPHVMKAESSGHNARTILKDPECFANLLRFYDGICEWEEGSATPILHIGWAKPFVSTISKFDPYVRAQIEIICHEDSVENTLNSEEIVKQIDHDIKICYDKMKNTLPVESSINEETAKRKSIRLFDRKNIVRNEGIKPNVTGGQTLKKDINNKFFNSIRTCANNSNIMSDEGTPPANNESIARDLPECQIIKGCEVNKSTSEILNINLDKNCMMLKDDMVEKMYDHIGTEMEKILNSRPIVALHSQKMKGLKHLLLAEKLNGQAISLQLTAQSQVQVNKKNMNDPNGLNTRSKRIRRE